MPILDYSNPSTLLAKFFVFKHPSRFSDKDVPGISRLLIYSDADQDLRDKLVGMYGNDIPISIFREIKPYMDNQDPKLMQLLINNNHWKYLLGKNARERFTMPEAITQFFACGLYKDIFLLPNRMESIAYNARLFRLLRVEFNMNIDNRDSIISLHGGAPIHMLIACCNTDQINTLIEANVPLWETDTAGKNPLMLVVLKGHHQEAQLLDGSNGGPRGSQMWLFHKILNANLNETKKHINDRAVNGMTALHAACAHGYGPYIYPLLEMGADPYVKDSTGCTPLDYLPISESCEVRNAESRRQIVQNWLLRDLPGVNNNKENFDYTATWDSRYSASKLSYKDVVDKYNEIKKKRLVTNGLGAVTTAAVNIKQLNTITKPESTVAKPTAPYPESIQIYCSPISEGSKVGDIEKKVEARKGHLCTTANQLNTSINPETQVAKSMTSSRLLIIATACIVCAGGIAAFVEGKRDNNIILLAVSTIALCCSVCLAVSSAIHWPTSTRRSTLLDLTESAPAKGVEKLNRKLI